MGVDGEDISVGELARRLERMERESQTGFASLHRRLDELNFVNPETLDTKLMLEAAHRQDLERQVADLAAARKEDERDRATSRRLAISALVSGLVLPVLVVILLASMGYGR